MPTPLLQIMTFRMDVIHNRRYWLISLLFLLSFVTFKASCQQTNHHHQSTFQNQIRHKVSYLCTPQLSWFTKELIILGGGKAAFCDTIQVK
jgi:hypothetical protein